MNKANEYYQLIAIPNFNWCFTAEKTFTSNGYAKLKGI
jgi:hypothetical protein